MRGRKGGREKEEWQEGRRGGKEGRREVRRFGWRDLEAKWLFLNTASSELQPHSAPNAHVLVGKEGVGAHQRARPPLRQKAAAREARHGRGDLPSSRNNETDVSPSEGGGRGARVSVS